MADDNSQIFSKEALDKLRSPERLDMMLPITTPVGWITMAAIGALLCSVVLWSIFGAFTVKADGMGMIMDSAGVVNISHIAGGKVSEVYIKTGSHIRRGQLIARLEQADQSAQTKMTQYGMGLAQSDRDAMSKACEYGAKKQQQTVAEAIYSDYDGIFDEVFVDKGKRVEPGMTIQLAQ